MYFFRAFLIYDFGISSFYLQLRRDIELDNEWKANLNEIRQGIQIQNVIEEKVFSMKSNFGSVRGKFDIFKNRILILISNKNVPDIFQAELLLQVYSNLFEVPYYFNINITELELQQKSEIENIIKKYEVQLVKQRFLVKSSPSESQSQLNYERQSSLKTFIVNSILTSQQFNQQIIQKQNFKFETNYLKSNQIQFIQNDFDLNLYVNLTFVNANAILNDGRQFQPSCNKSDQDQKAFKGFLMYDQKKQYFLMLIRKDFSNDKDWIEERGRIQKYIIGKQKQKISVMSITTLLAQYVIEYDGLTNFYFILLSNNKIPESPQYELLFRLKRFIQNESDLQKQSKQEIENLCQCAVSDIIDAQERIYRKRYHPQNNQSNIQTYTLQSTNIQSMYCITNNDEQKQKFELSQQF